MFVLKQFVKDLLLPPTIWLVLLVAVVVAMAASCFQRAGPVR